MLAIKNNQINKQIHNISCQEHTWAINLNKLCKCSLIYVASHLLLTNGVVVGPVTWVVGAGIVVVLGDNAVVSGAIMIKGRLVTKRYDAVRYNVYSGYIKLTSI